MSAASTDFLPDALLADSVQELFHLYLVNAGHNCCRFLFETVMTTIAFPGYPPAGHCPGARAALLARCYKYGYKEDDNVNTLLFALTSTDNSAAYGYARSLVADNPTVSVFPAAEAYIRSVAQHPDLVPAPCPAPKRKRK